MIKPYFEPLRILDEVFDLSHLEPFTFIVDSNKANKKLRIRVTFSNHCFTKKYTPETHTEGEPIIDEGLPRPRSFCRVRYRLSFDLREVIKNLNHPKSKVWETAAERNWAHSITIENPTGPYHIFFEVKRASNEQKKLQDLNLIVESAYHEEEEYGAPRLKGSMTFILLCGKVYNREPTATKR